MGTSLGEKEKAKKELAQYFEKFKLMENDSCQCKASETG
jgi:hypothetical protein